MFKRLFQSAPFGSRMSDSVARFKKDLDLHRIGRPNPKLLDSITVVLGNKSAPLHTIARVNVKDAQNLIVITEEQFMPSVEKAIRSSKLGLNPQKLENKAFKVPIPRPTKEFKEQILKSISKAAENARIAIRNCRQDARQAIRSSTGSDDFKKSQEKEIQKLTDSYIKEIDSIMSIKKKELDS